MNPQFFFNIGGQIGLKMPPKRALFMAGCCYSGYHPLKDSPHFTFTYLLNYSNPESRLENNNKETTLEILFFLTQKSKREKKVPRRLKDPDKK